MHLVADMVHSRWTLTSTTTLFTSTYTPRGRYGPLEMDSHIHDNTIHKYMTTLYASTCTPRGRCGPFEMDSHIHDITIYKYMYTSWQIRFTQDGLSHPRQHHSQVHIHLVADTVHSRWTLTSTTIPYTSTCTPRGRYGPLEMDSHIHDNTTHKYIYTSWQIRFSYVAHFFASKIH